MTFAFLVVPLEKSVAGESGEYLIDVWSSENGLPNSSVTAITQTPDGYLWVGTYNGLARFDGVRFVNFDPFNTPELAQARVRRLFVDESGTMWVNTFDGSLTSYRNGNFRKEWTGNGSSDSWVTAVSLQTNQLTFLLHTGELIKRGGITNEQSQWKTLRPPGFSSGELAVADRDGTIWCRGKDQKLWRLKDETFIAVPSGSGVTWQFILALVADSKGRVWIGTENELALWDGNQFVSQSPTNNPQATNFFRIHAGDDGNTWVISGDRVLKTRNKQWIFEAESCRGIFTGVLDRLGMKEDRAGGIWIYHYGKGLYHVDAEGKALYVSGAENFPGQRIDSFFEDKEGNLWVGVDRGGLVRLREKRFSVLLPDDSPASKRTVSVAEDAQGAIWVGTFGGGIYRLNKNGWQNFSRPDEFPQRFIFSIFPADNNRLWVSAGEEDLYSFDERQFQPVTPPVHGIKSLLLGRDGRLWIGTKSGLRFLSDGAWNPLPLGEDVKAVDIRALAEDRNGIIWAGGGNGTLYRVETNSITRFRSEGTRASQPIWSLLADDDGSLWVGTFRGGLLRFRDGHFTRYTGKDGLPDEVICQILDDNFGRIWIGSQKGIFWMTKADLDAFAKGQTKALNCTSYGRYDGLLSLECSGSYQPACWRTKDGRLLFTTLKGVASVHPAEVSPNSVAPSVLIEDALVDGLSQVFGREKRAGGRQPPDERASLILPPGKRQIELRYTGLSFVSPDRVRFRYKLEGLEEDWSEAGTRRTAQYSFLRPGQYTFRVIACNNDGVWNPKSADLRLVVLPHFYETTWFLVTLWILVIGLVVVAVRQVMVRRIRGQMQVLERQQAVERDRTRIAKDIHDDLGAGLTHISLLTELARRAPDEGKTHLNQISDTARELTRSMDEIVWAVDPENDTLDALLTYLCKFAQEYLSVAGIRCRLDLPAQTPPWELRAEVRHNLFLAFKEALNNIIKHAGATEVWLRLALRTDEFTLTLEDNGSGLTPNLKESAPSGDRISSGHGLINLEERLAAIGGRCVVTSQPEKGTRIEMTVSLKDHPNWR